MTDLFEKLKRKVLDYIDRNEWLLPQMKILSKRKIDSLVGSFVGSDMFFNASFMEQRYNDVRFTA